MIFQLATFFLFFQRDPEGKSVYRNQLQRHPNSLIPSLYANRKIHHNSPHTRWCPPSYVFWFIIPVTRYIYHKSYLLDIILVIKVINQLSYLWDSPNMFPQIQGQYNQDPQDASQALLETISCAAAGRAKQTNPWKRFGEHRWKHNPSDRTPETTPIQNRCKTSTKTSDTVTSNKIQVAHVDVYNCLQIHYSIYFFGVCICFGFLSVST